MYLLLSVIWMGLNAIFLLVFRFNLFFSSRTNISRNHYLFTFAVITLALCMAFLFFFGILFWFINAVEYFKSLFLLFSTVIHVILAIVSYQAIKSLEEFDLPPSRSYMIEMGDSHPPQMYVKRCNRSWKQWMVCGTRIGNSMPSNNSSNERGDAAFTITNSIYNHKSSQNNDSHLISSEDFGHCANDWPSDHFYSNDTKCTTSYFTHQETFTSSQNL